MSSIPLILSSLQTLTYVQQSYILLRLLIYGSKVIRKWLNRTFTSDTTGNKI